MSFSKEKSRSKMLNAFKFVMKDTVECKLIFFGSALWCAPGLY